MKSRSAQVYLYTRNHKNENLAEEEIDLSSKEKGIYFLEAIAGNGTFRKKLVIE